MIRIPVSRFNESTRGAGPFIATLQIRLLHLYVASGAGQRLYWRLRDELAPARLEELNRRLCPARRRSGLLGYGRITEADREPIATTGSAITWWASCSPAASRSSPPGRGDALSSRSPHRGVLT
jgi:hypothetical protein